MSNMLLKNTFRGIRDTKARFLSIMLIIMLGVGFFAGIKSSDPSMKAVAETYYSDTNLMDFRLVSTVGFSQEDIDAVRDTEGVTAVAPSNFSDVLLDSLGSGSVVRLYSLPQAESGGSIINAPVLKSGRLPQKSDEVVVGTSSFEYIGIGDTLSFTREDTDISDILSNTEYTVVGTVDWSMYISFERGVTDIGSGKVSTFMLIPGENFAFERNTELYVTADFSDEYSPFSAEYKDAVAGFTKKLEKVADARVEYFQTNTVDTAQSSIDEARQMLEDERASAQKKLDSAKKEIDSGWETYYRETGAARAELNTSYIELTDGERKAAQAREQFYAAMAQAELQLINGEEEIRTYESQLAQAKVQLISGLYDGLREFGIADSVINQYLGNKTEITAEDVEEFSGLAGAYSAGLALQLDSINQQLQAIKSDAEKQGTAAEFLPEYITLTEQKSVLEGQLAALEDFQTNKKPELLSAIKQMEHTQATIDEAKLKLTRSRAELEKKRTQTQSELDAVEARLAAAWEQYNDGVAQLKQVCAETEKKLNDAQRQYDTSLAEAEQKIADAEHELADAERKLSELSEPQWYVLDRDDNPGYSSFEENVARVDAVGTVFPVFFLLVAVLVCVTTMSRLVEEKRGDIGALATLGYNKQGITLTFVLYSSLATFVGCVVGITVGVPVMPTVIFNAYRMIYSMPQMVIRINPVSTAIGVAAAFICTLSVTVFTCRKLLSKTPATLLRPKAPKPGKRIMLERINILWRHFGFTSKVTARNIFRYKARFLMTVIGVAGCTALILAGLGLHDSIGDIVSKQYGEIFIYDALIVPAEREGAAQSLTQAVRSDSRFEHSALCRQSLVTVSAGDTQVNEDVYVMVPEDIGDFEDIVFLSERETGKAIALDNSGAVVSEKLAATLGVSAGDTVFVTDDAHIASFTVSAVCENYVYGYVYISPDAYREAFGTQAKSNLIMCTSKTLTETSDSEIGNEYLVRDDVLGVNFMSSSIDSFNDMIGSLNFVVVVMVVCAAALAFVVLYNLTNINIAERKREIATLKVLGFKGSETSAYIYRENIVLTVIGTAVGLLLGVFLLKYIIVTVEIDIVMFGRTIHFMSYVWAAVMTALFAAVVNLIMHFRIRSINMVESLKSVE